MDMKKDDEEYETAMMAKVVRDLILKMATETIPLADVLTMAYEAGYDVSEFGGRLAQPMAEPDGSGELVSAPQARSLLRQALRDFQPDTFLDAAAEDEWVWCEDLSGWIPAGMDCLIRPGENGLIVMEAAGEYAGKVVVRDGAPFASFPEKTFR